MLKVTDFTSILQVQTAYEAFVYETGKSNIDFTLLSQHLGQYRTEINIFARKYETVKCYFPLSELERRKGLLSSLRELLKSNRATNEELLLYFKKLPEEVQGEYRALSVNAGIKNLEGNIRKLLQLKGNSSDKANTLLDLQIEWLTGEIAKYKTQEFIFRELLKLKPKIHELEDQLKAKRSPYTSPLELYGLGQTDITDLWWEQRATYEGLFQDMKRNLANRVYSGKLTPAGGILNDRVVKLENGTRPFNAHFAFNGNYIQTACPRAYTVIDFYKMIQEQSSSTVVMLNGLEEYAQFIPYWPAELRTPQYFGETQVVLLDHTETFVHASGANSKNKTALPSISNRTVRISSPGKPPRIITLFQYHNWGDGRKGDEVCTNKLIDMIDQSQLGKTAPVVIHCGAGMGRTGTFTAILKLAHDLKDGKQDLKVRDAVVYQRDLETGRGGGMVNEEQYLFCHSALQHRLQSSLYY